MSTEKLTGPKIRKFYNEIDAHPEFAKELTDYQRAKVVEFADNELDIATKHAIFFLEISDDSNYPDNVREDERLDYWLSRSSKFKTARRVKHIITNLDSDPVDSKRSETRPVDKQEWIKEKYKELRDEFNTDDEWAEHVSILFKKEFKTSKGSPGSMKSYGVYNR